MWKLGSASFLQPQIELIYRKLPRIETIAKIPWSSDQRQHKANRGQAHIFPTDDDSPSNFEAPGAARHEGRQY
jgi:hypothetical protein